MAAALANKEAAAVRVSAPESASIRNVTTGQRLFQFGAAFSGHFCLAEV
jgi:hypothetical protein